MLTVGQSGEIHGKISVLSIISIKTQVVAFHLTDGKTSFTKLTQTEGKFSLH